MTSQRRARSPSGGGGYSAIQSAHSHLVQLLATARKVEPTVFRCRSASGTGLTAQIHHVTYRAVSHSCLCWAVSPYPRVKSGILKALSYQEGSFPRGAVAASRFVLASASWTLSPARVPPRYMVTAVDIQTCRSGTAAWAQHSGRRALRNGGGGHAVRVCHRAGSHSRTDSE